MSVKLPCDDHIGVPLQNVIPEAYQEDSGMMRTPMLNCSTAQQDYYNRPQHKSSEDAMCIAILAAAGAVGGWLVSIIPTPALVLGGMAVGVVLACLLRIGDDL